MELIKFIQQFSNPLLDTFFQMITMIGEDTFFILVTAVIYWCIDKELGYKLGFVTLTSACVNFGIKEFLKVPRPIGEPGIRSLRLHTAAGYSFPSGHTQNTTTLWTFFMLYFKRSWLYIASISIILLVGISRLYLGVHTPADVAGGMLIGAVWVLFWGYLYEKAQRHKDKRLLILAVVIATIGLLVFKETNYYKVVGALTGLLLGYLIEPRFINFNERTSLTAQVLKVSFGMGTLYILRLVMKSTLPEHLITDHLGHLVMLVWVTIIAPLVFKLPVFNGK
jgi:membrane-associated phospholipid phosphatase